MTGRRQPTKDDDRRLPHLPVRIMQAQRLQRAGVQRQRVRLQPPQHVQHRPTDRRQLVGKQPQQRRRVVWSAGAGLSTTTM